VWTLLAAALFLLWVGTAAMAVWGLRSLPQIEILPANETPALPRLSVIVPARNEEEVIERFTGQGLAGFIQKPYRMAALRAMLRSVLEA